MTPFRGSDEELDREIAAVERLVRVRLRRATYDLRELGSELAYLRRERNRRRGSNATAVGATTPPLAQT